MPKNKPLTSKSIHRSSTWYRQVQQEKNQVIKSIGTSVLGTPFIPPATPGSSSAAGTSNANHVISPIEVDLQGSIEELSPSDSLSSPNGIFGSSSDSDDSHFEVMSNTNLDNTEVYTSLDTSYVHVPLGNNPSDQLRNWSVSHNIPHTALRDLLKILSDSGGQFKDLPKDPRTFLKTPKKTLVRNVNPGQYCHIGLQKSLEDQYRSRNLIPLDEIKIGINIDGLPIAKSSSSQLYPILGINKSLCIDDNVFLIGVYHGYKKPDSFNEFLSDFVSEAIDLSLNGVLIFNKKYPFKISMFLMDAVAKAGILYIKGHSGYNSCTKCTQDGEYISDRVCFVNLHFTKRTHQDFVDQNDPGHHVGATILLNIPGINIIQDVPLDYMHLVLLGVVKKLLCGTWCFGKPPHKLSSKQIFNATDGLKALKPYVPSEFARKPRTLLEVKRWKATEYRQFLLYTGPIVLINIISKEKYQHFLTLTVAISLLSTDNISETFLNYAETLLLYFVKTTKDLYGLHFLSHNLHNLLHLTDDVRNFGSLNKFSNFSSENFLQSLLKLLRKHDNPLSQIVRRINEINQNTIGELKANSSQFTLSQSHCEAILVEGCTGPEFKTITFKSFKVSVFQPDSCCLLSNDLIIEVCNIAYSEDLKEPVIIGRCYSEKNNFFEKPCLSGLLGIYLVSKLGSMSFWPVSAIKGKLVRLPFKDKHVIFPLLHLKQ